MQDSVAKEKKWGKKCLEICAINPISPRGGGHICPPSTYLRITVQKHVRGRLKNLTFPNCKFGKGQFQIGGDNALWQMTFEFSIFFNRSLRFLGEYCKSNVSMIQEGLHPASGFETLCPFYGQLKQWSKILISDKEMNKRPEVSRYTAKQSGCDILDNF